MYKVIQKESFSDTTFLMEVEAPDVARAAKPGQFLIVRLGEGRERIPLTIADFDREKGTVTMVVQVVGKSTKEMSYLKVGDYIQDVAGPLGRPSHIEKRNKVVLVGGGLGVAPVYPILRAHKEAGSHTISIIGFRNRSLIFWEERFRRYSDELIICTDDGSYGRKGLVSLPLQEILEADEKRRGIEEVIAIGPMIMMKVISEVTKPYGIKTTVSLNTIMLDGMGMCGGCRVTVGGGDKFACVDGPDFDGHEVDWENLLKRQKRYEKEEKLSLRLFDEHCKLVERGLLK
jgi:glutamate synthase (NADPH/NADH) small chain